MKYGIRLVESGDIYLDKYSGWYSVSDEAFYDEDEIEDINGKKKSKSSGSLVEWVEEESYFFKLSTWSKKLLEFYKKILISSFLSQEKMKLLNL